MSEIGIISSGDPDIDRERLEQAIQFENEIEANRCPNGCGEMFKASDRMSECTECGFVLHRSTIGARDMV